MQEKIQEGQIRKRKNGVGSVKDVGDTNQDQFRVVVSKEANASLEQFLEKVNEGLVAGEISRSDAADYILCNLTKLMSESDVKSLRNLHFDDRKVLAALLKKSSEDKELPEEIRRALREHYGIPDKERKRSARAHNELSTVKAVDNSRVE